MAHAKMVFALLVLGACGAPQPPPAPQAPTFACGKSTCDASMAYCERQLGDLHGPEIDTCKPLPGPCRAARDCTCFPQDTPCALFKQCTVAPAGDRVGLTMSCPGG